MNKTEIVEELLTYEIKNFLAVWRKPGAKGMDELEKSILSEIIRLEAEIDRLRWHYPNQGEFPEEKRLVFIQGYENKIDYMTINYTNNDREKYVEIVKRWRYVD